MALIVGLILVVCIIYLAFLNKRKNNEVIIHVVSGAGTGLSEANYLDEVDEEKDNWESFDFYNSKMLPARGSIELVMKINAGSKLSVISK